MRIHPLHPMHPYNGRPTRANGRGLGQIDEAGSAAQLALFAIGFFFLAPMRQDLLTRRSAPGRKG